MALLHASVRGQNDLISPSDLEEAMECAFVKLADGTKREEQGCHPQGPSQAGEMGWQELWEIQRGPNMKSCTCEGRAPAAVQVGTGGQGSTSEERDWGGQAGSELGMGQQCAWQQQQLTATWAVLASYTATRSRKVIIPLDLALGRPHLEYCDQFLDPPQFRKDVDKLEQVLWRATERVEAGVLVLLGEAEGQGLAQPGEETASGSISRPRPAGGY